MISGVPPQRLYVHPDEQIELLKRQKNEGKTGLPALEAEREWVMPSHLREKWSLRRFGEIFDVIPAAADEPSLLDEAKMVPEPGSTMVESKSQDLITDPPATQRDSVPKHWRLSQPKRLLLAIVDDDSTVVYYIIHDGIVKPRQN